MFAVDTNIFVYAYDADAPEHSICKPLVEKWRLQQEPWCTCWNILYEFLRITTHRKVWRKACSIDNSAQFIDGILASPSLRLLSHTDNHASMLATTLHEIPGLHGNVVFDLHTAVLLRENGVRRLYTHDGDFHRFPFLEVIDPLRPA